MLKLIINICSTSLELVFAIISFLTFSKILLRNMLKDILVIIQYISWFLPQWANLSESTQLSCRWSWYLSGLVTCSTSTLLFSIPTASHSPVGQYPSEKICNETSYGSYMSYNLYTILSYISLLQEFFSAWKVCLFVGVGTDIECWQISTVCFSTSSSTVKSLSY